MATPAFSIQSPAVVMNTGQPFSLKFLSLNTATPPVAIDISTGYIVANHQIAPASDVNTKTPGIDLSGIGTHTFSSTGLTWSLTKAQLDSLSAQLTTLHSFMVLELSNDSGTTQSLMVASNVTLNTFNNLS